MTALAIDEITDVDAFTALEPEWWDLWHRCPAATPFQTPAWLLSWWNAFAPGALRVIAARTGGRLVGLAPLYGEVGALGRRLLPIGVSLSDYLDVLIDDEQPDVADALMRRIVDFGSRWDSCEFTELAPSSAAGRLVCPSDCVETDGAVSACPVLLLPNRVEQLRQVLPSDKFRSLRTAHNRAARRGTVEIISGNDSNCATTIAVLIRLHGLCWGNRGEPGVLTDRRVCGFLLSAAERLMHVAVARIYALSIAGGIAAVYFGFMHRDCAYGYLTGFDPAYGFESPGTIVIGHAIETAVREGAREFHFLRGREAYKYGWGAVDRWNRQRVFRRADTHDKVA